MIALDLLRQQYLFRDLPTDVLTRIAAQTQPREFQKNQTVIREGDPGNALLILVSGKLQVITLSERGKEVGLNFIESGDHFGEISVIDGRPRSASVVAIKSSIVGFVPKTEALWLFQDHPLVAERIQRRLCQTIRREIEKRSAQSGAKAHARICSVIIENQLLSPRDQDGSNPIENFPNQRVIATMASVSRETVSRVMQSLARAGVLERHSRKIVVKNMGVLRRLANGELSLSVIQPPPQ